MQIIWVIICHRGKSGTPQALHCMNPMDFSTLGMKPVALNSSPEINKSEHRWSNNQESLSKHAMGWRWLEKTVTSWEEQKKHMLTWIDLIGSHLRISLKSQVLTFPSIWYIYIYYKYHISSVKFSNSTALNLRPASGEALRRGVTTAHCRAAFFCWRTACKTLGPRDGGSCSPMWHPYIYLRLP